jgi:hypothetical protein
MPLPYQKEKGTTRLTPASKNCSPAEFHYSRNLFPVKGNLRLTGSWGDILVQLMGDGTIPEEGNRRHLLAKRKSPLEIRAIQGTKVEKTGKSCYYIIYPPLA